MSVFFFPFYKPRYILDALLLMKCDVLCCAVHASLLPPGKTGNKKKERKTHSFPFQEKKGGGWEVKYIKNREEKKKKKK